jgi:hypothetical protein
VRGVGVSRDTEKKLIKYISNGSLRCNVYGVYANRISAMYSVS